MREVSDSPIRFFRKKSMAASNKKLKSSRYTARYTAIPSNTSDTLDIFPSSDEDLVRDDNAKSAENPAVEVMGAKMLIERVTDLENDVKNLKEALKKTREQLKQVTWDAKWRR